MRNKYFCSVLFVFSLLISVGTVSAQNAGIKGFVYEKETGEPAIFTNVFLKGTTYGVSTDINGYFSINKIPPGNYTLIVYSLSYDSLQMPVTLVANDLITKKLVVSKRSVSLKAVEISAEKQEMRTDVKMSVTKITPQEIKSLPSVGGEPDLAQYLQVLPGVVFTGDQGGQLYIRGGTPIQNKVLLDGMIIYNPFHSIGLFSVFDTDIISNADVYTGGFPAQYSGRISSVMDISTRDGNKKRFSGKVSASPFMAKALIEGPLIKAKSDDDVSTSFLLSIKDSYLDKTSPVVYPYVNNEEGLPYSGLPYSFTDIYGKISLNGSNGSKVNMFGFNFRDKVDYSSVAKFNWNSSGFGTKFVVVPGNSPTLMDGNISFSKYAMELTEENQKPRTSDVNGFNMGLNFTYFLRNDELKYGIEILGFKTAYDFYNLVGLHYGETQNTTEFGFYLNYKKVWSRVVLNPSIRLHYFASLGEFSPEPRIGVKWNALDIVRIKVAAGIYKQDLISATSDKDIVNLFYGFLSDPESLPETFDGNSVDSKLQEATHLLGGIEIDLPRHFELNIEAYIKYFNQLINVNNSKIYDDTFENFAQPDELKKDYIIETGKAYGGDVTLKYNYKKLYLWAVYSLGFVDRYNGHVTYNPSWDRRHNINLVGTYTFGKKLNWEVDARWNFGSGFPFSPTQGFYPYLSFDDGLYTDYTAENGYLGVQYGEYNSRRLPTYHRLDLSLKKIFTLSKTSKIEATFSLTNVYDRQNIFYFDRVTYTRINQLPILPSLAMNWSF